MSVVSPVGGEAVGLRQSRALVGILFIGILVGVGVVRNDHGLHILDFPQLLLGVVQIQLQLLHFQPLALQRQVGQGGVEGHQKIALFHRVPLGNLDLRHRLSGGQVHGLNLVGTHGAVAFLGIAPVFRHADVVEGKHLHRLLPAPAHAEPDAQADGGCQHYGGDGKDDFLLTCFTLHHRCLPPAVLCPCAADRPECDRFYRRTGQWPAHG